MAIIPPSKAPSKMALAPDKLFKKFVKPLLMACHWDVNKEHEETSN
jgi:hypothetical protein